MGSSILSMPWGVQRAGLLGGLLLMILMGALCLYTSHLILRVHSYYSGQGEYIDVGDMCRMLLGRYTAVISRVVSLIVLLGASIVYWVLMSNFFYNSVTYFHVVCPRFQDAFVPNLTMETVGVNTMAETPSFNGTMPIVADDTTLYERLWSVQGTVPIFLAVIVFPLVNFRSATFFTKFNSLGTLSVIYLIIFVIAKAASWGIHINPSPINNLLVNGTIPIGSGVLKEIMDVTTPLFLPSFPALSGMLALSFFIHNIIINIMRNNKYQENNGRDLSIAFILVTTTYLIIGGVFYLSFPLNKECIEDAFLNNFPIWDGMTVVARLFLLFQLMTVYPLLVYMLRVQLFAALPFLNPPVLHHVTSFNKVSAATSSPPQARMLTIAWYTCEFTGAVSGFVYVFTIPCLLHIASEKLNYPGEGACSTGVSFTSLTFHLAIPLLALANLIAQFFISDS
ncbi:hypothetical protein J437_LFUL012194 [Ladona fulva]|uniref:Amino acid transporter transmembrane domain-containing protein n=1 Tax=Ladona fulva TaxID=123851 RepID=A0A8K0P9G6_LADFU|nr:hypothetical protein J437_LFUL012194 [Ladona fulva]